MIGPVRMISREGAIGRERQRDRSGAQSAALRTLTRCPPPPPSPATCGRFCAGRDFRRLFATRLVSQARRRRLPGGPGEPVLLLAASAPRRRRGGRCRVHASAFLPYTLVGPFAGVLLDRWRRRQILLVANLLRTARARRRRAWCWRRARRRPAALRCSCCLPVGQPLLPRRAGASLPHVVPADELVMANAVSPTSGTMRRAARRRHRATGCAGRRGHGDAARTPPSSSSPPRRTSAAACSPCGWHPTCSAPTARHRRGGATPVADSAAGRVPRGRARLVGRRPPPAEPARAALPRSRPSASTGSPSAW